MSSWIRAKLASARDWPTPFRYGLPNSSPAIRLAVQMLEEGATGNEAWEAWVSAGSTTPEPIRALELAAAVHGRKALKRRKPKRKPASVQPSLEL